MARRRASPGIFPVCCRAHGITRHAGQNLQAIGECDRAAQQKSCATITPRPDQPTAHPAVAAVLPKNMGQDPCRCIGEGRSSESCDSNDGWCGVQHICVFKPDTKGHAQDMRGTRLASRHHIAAAGARTHAHQRTSYRPSITVTSIGAASARGAGNAGDASFSGATSFRRSNAVMCLPSCAQVFRRRSPT